MFLVKMRCIATQNGGFVTRDWFAAKGTIGLSLVIEQFVLVMGAYNLSFRHVIWLLSKYVGYQQKIRLPFRN